MNLTKRRFHTRQATFRQFEIFKAVAELKSVTLAAKHLHLAQPTISTQIHNLSESLGVPLFERIGKQLHLTNMGNEVLDSVRRLFNTIDNLEMTLAEIEGLSYGHLRISVVTTAKYLIPQYLGEFCRQFPGISPEFQVVNRAENIQRLQHNLDDLYVFSNPPKELDIHAEYITENPLVVVAPSEHPLATSKSISWNEVESERLLMREQGSGTRYAVEKHFEKHKFSAQHAITIASNEAIKESVLAGLGVGILSRHALAHMAPGNLVELPVETFPIANTWYWVEPRGKALSPAAKAFKEFVATEIAD